MLHRSLVTLTYKERQIAILVGRGLTNKEIALVLEISHFTVRNHVTTILKKLNIRNRSELAFVVGSDTRETDTA